MIALRMDETMGSAKLASSAFHPHGGHVPPLLDSERVASQHQIMKSDSSYPPLRFLSEWTEIRKSRNHLPHWDAERNACFITFRLADSLPAGIFYPNGGPSATHGWRITRSHGPLKRKRPTTSVFPPASIRRWMRDTDRAFWASWETRLLFQTLSPAAMRWITCSTRGSSCQIMCMCWFLRFRKSRYPDWWPDGNASAPRGSTKRLVRRVPFDRRITSTA